MNKKKRSPKAIGSVFRSVFTSIGKGGLYDLMNIEMKWDEIVGPQLAAVSIPAHLSANKTLTIWAAEPVWVDSMGYHKANITKKVNLALGKNAVRSIDITMNVEAKQSIKKQALPITVEETKKLSASEIDEMEKALEQISDSQLRETLKKVILKSARRKP